MALFSWFLFFFFYLGKRTFLQLYNQENVLRARVISGLVFPFNFSHLSALQPDSRCTFKHLQFPHALYVDSWRPLSIEKLTLHCRHTSLILVLSSFAGLSARLQLSNKMSPRNMPLLRAASKPVHTRKAQDVQLGLFNVFTVVMVSVLMTS